MPGWAYDRESFCQAVGWQRCSKGGCADLLFSLSLSGFLVFLGRVIWGFAVSITRKIKALKKLGWRKNIQELKSGNLFKSSPGKAHDDQKFEKAGNDYSVQNPAFPRTGKNVPLVQRCFGAPGACRSGPTSKVLSWRPFHVCARMQERNRRQDHEAEGQENAACGGRRLRCCGSRGCARGPAAHTERGSGQPRNGSTAKAALSSRNVHGMRESSWTLRYMKPVNRRCQSFSLAWGFQSLLLVKWLITHLFGFLDPFICFLPSINLC